MGLLQNIQRFFSTHTETSENHPISELRSHYYKVTNKKAIETVQEVLKRTEGFEVTSVSEERGEISVNVLKPKKALLIVTIISVRPLETAVDFSVSTDTPLPTDFGYSRKLISTVYNKLDREMTFVGTGIHSS
ncbi:cytosolic protein [Metabacillus arenae]|uniref:Cytosolic protein n=1 Tax=Metabacillus arenae TaxID=2771434 RepID=A0A926NEL0_9BACI|nr:cytosolic protein [Metabacillus arenae]MBD1380079.1 cytosolic protein [Metabacillus arenae]